MFGLVMLFHQERDAVADLEMQVLTQALIDAALVVGGRYYLPYRLHATPEQLTRAYAQAPKFFELKRKYDPDEMFQNYFYTKYGKFNQSKLELTNPLSRSNLFLIQDFRLPESPVDLQA